MGIQNVLGVNYPYPDTGDKPWGVEHIDWATAVSNATNTLNAAVGTLPTDVTALQLAVTNLQTDVTTLQTDKVETSSNSGAGEGLALPKVGVDLPFKSITAGANIVLTASATELNIDSVAGGTGDVVGPASSVDDRICTFDGITGKLIQDSGTTIASLLASISPPNYVVSSSSGGTISPALGDGPVTNFSVTITTLGGPVIIKVIPDGTSNASTFGNSNTGATQMEFNVLFKRNGTTFGRQKFQIGADSDTAGVPTVSFVGPGAIGTMDFQPAGTYTYTVELDAISSTTGGRILYSKLVAYELK